MSIGRLPGLLPDNPDRTRRDMILKTDKEEKTFVLSGILVFADKIIDTETAKYIKEVVRMTQVAELLLEEGADGFYVTGSTGECFLLTDEERTRVVAAVAEAVSTTLPSI